MDDEGGADSNLAAFCITLMKGFGIEIKNTLLDPKHVKAMGTAVWLYMWLIDKITRITEDGKGIVLGGRPIIYEEVKAELGIHQNTYTKWIKKLGKYPYIETTLTPHGIVFRVLKAHKKFGKRFLILKKRFTEVGKRFT